MTIIIIDSQPQREQAIKRELIRAGWLVGEMHHSNSALALTLNSIHMPSFWIQPWLRSQ